MPLPLFRARTRARARSHSDLMSATGVVKRWRVNIADHPASSLPADLATVGLNGTVKRDPDLWFDDGNIVLLARDTAFRVYRGLLTRHSVIFRDLFQMAQPANAETMESCPVVHLSDSPDDLRYLLRALCGLRKYVYSCFLCFSSSQLRCSHGFGVRGGRFESVHVSRKDGAMSTKLIITHVAAHMCPVVSGFSRHEGYTCS